MPVTTAADHMGYVKRKSAFKHALNGQIQIIMCMQSCISRAFAFDSYIL